MSIKRTTTIIYAGEYIAFTWKLNLSSSLECNEFLNDSPIFFKELFIMIQDLGLIKLKKYNNLLDRNNSTFAYTRKKKLPKTIKESRITLMRKTCPAFVISTKSYYYISQKNT